MKSRGFFRVFCGAWFLAAAASGRADIVVDGADGSDGAFNPVANTTVNLANSPTAAWNGVNPDPATPLTGVYDAEKWAVVFRFSSVNIPAGVTVTFTNHPSRAPVVWLVDGPVTLSGIVQLSGANGHNGGGPTFLSESGPGGFRGGRGNNGTSSPQSGGFGPGGARNPAIGNTAPGGSYGTQGVSGGGGTPAGPTYGNEACIPLLGGSGGTGYLRTPQNSAQDGGGGAGGGAILIVASQSITIGTSPGNGLVRANGGFNATAGGSGGSGGAIRLVADTVSGSGSLSAIGQSNGGDGRIRIETNNASTLTGTPNPSLSTVGSTALIWPESSAPTIKVTVLDGNAVPVDPIASLDFPSADLNITNPNPMVLQLDTTNVPPTSTVKVRVVPKSGTSCLAGMESDCTYMATHVSGDTTASTWTATIRVPDGFSAIQAHAVLP